MIDFLWTPGALAPVCQETYCRCYRFLAFRPFCSGKSM